MRIWQRHIPLKKTVSFPTLPLPFCYQRFCYYCVVQVWFSWMVLNMESIFEEDSQLRRVVEGELVINALTPDQALKVRELLICFYGRELLEKRVLLYCLVFISCAFSYQEKSITNALYDWLSRRKCTSGKFSFTF